MRMVLLIALLAPTVARASTARLVDGSGIVRVVDEGGIERAAHNGDRIVENETVRTGDDGQARLLVDDQAVIELGPSSQLHMRASHATGSSSIALVAGRLWARVSTLFSGHTFEVTTDNAVAGVRGTSFFAEVDGDATVVSVEAGSVEVKSRTGETAVLGIAERARVSEQLERSQIDSGGLDRLRERIVGARDRHDELGAVRSGLSREMNRLRDSDREDSKLHEALRELMRNRRDGGLDIDPGIARRLLERLRELREQRRQRR